MSVLAKRRWMDWTAITAVALLFCGVTYLFVDRQVRVQQINALASALSQQRSQAQRAGQTPVAPPPAQILASPGIVKGDPGATGPAGAAGRGLTALWCTSGRWQVSFTDGTLITDAGACTGLPGIPGIPGVAGSPGPTGSVGPAGPQGAGATGPPGPAGSPGTSGTNGKDGAAGQNGADGKPPAGWTYTDVTGTKYRCDRDSTSPDSAPRYVCRPSSP